MRRELGQKVLTRGRRAGEQDSIRFSGNGGAGSGGRFGEQGDEARIKTRPDNELTKRARRRQSAHSGLEPDGIAGDEGLDDLHAGQEQRVIAWADNQHDSAWLAHNFTAHAGEPEWKSPATECARRENFFRLAIQKPTGFRQRQDFGGE